VGEVGGEVFEALSHRYKQFFDVLHLLAAALGAFLEDGETVPEFAPVARLLLLRSNRFLIAPS